MSLTARPAPDEFSDDYSSYVALVPPGDLLDALLVQIDELHACAARAEERGADFRYADGKWTLRELFRHVEECERVMAYRALRIGRGDVTPLPGFDQDVLIDGGAGDRRAPREIATAMDHLRRANVSLFGAFDAEALGRRGRMSDTPCSTLAILCILHGHVAHHLRVAAERYLG